MVTYPALPVSAPYDLALYGSKRRAPRRIGDDSSGTGSTVREDGAFRPEGFRAFCHQIGSGWKCYTTGSTFREPWERRPGVETGLRTHRLG